MCWGRSKASKVWGAQQCHQIAGSGMLRGSMQRGHETGFSLSPTWTAHNEHFQVGVADVCIWQDLEFLALQG
jgi:hypothetical protein